MSAATQPHTFVPGEQRPSSAGWYRLCATCRGTEEAVFSDRSAVHLRPRDREYASIEATCGVCGDQIEVPGAEDPASTLCVACADERDGGWAGPWPEDEQENTGAEA